MAFRGVFLHVLGDFMGSVIAIAAALVVMFAGDSPLLHMQIQQVLVL